MKTLKCTYKNKAETRHSKPREMRSLAECGDPRILSKSSNCLHPSATEPTSWVTHSNKQWQNLEPSSISTSPLSIHWEPIQPIKPQPAKPNLFSSTSSQSSPYTTKSKKT